MVESIDRENRYITGSIIGETPGAKLIFVVKLNQDELDKPSKHWVPKNAIIEETKIGKKLLLMRIEPWKFDEIKNKTNGKISPQKSEFINETVIESSDKKNEELEVLLPLVKEMVDIKHKIGEMDDKINQLNRKKGKIQRQIRRMVPDWVDYCKRQGKGRTFSMNNGFSKINFTLSVSPQLMKEKDLYDKIGESIYKTEKTLKTKTELRKQFGNTVLGDEEPRITVNTSIQEHHPKFIAIALRESMTSLIDNIFDDAISNNNLLNLVSMIYITEDRMDEVLTDCGNNNGQKIRKVGNFSYFRSEFGVMDIIYVFQGDEKLGHKYFRSIFNSLKLDNLMDEFCSNGELGIIEGKYIDRFSHIVWSCLG